MIKFCMFSFFLTRTFYITIIIFSYSFLVDKYELSSELITQNSKDFSNSTNFEKIIIYFLKHFYSYDSVHFIHLARNNYTTDFNYAFFPLFPIAITYFNYCLKILLNIFPFFRISNNENLENIYLLLSGFILSNILCLLNTIILYKLTYFLTNSYAKSKLVSFLFLINPGTIFFITAYSENLYLCLQLLLILMLLVNQQEKNFLSFLFFLTFLITCRSTSLFLTSYFLIPIINNIVLPEGKKYESESFKNNLNKLFNSLKNNIRSLGKVVVLIGHCYLTFLWTTKIRPSSDICQSVNYNINQNSDIMKQGYKSLVNEYRSICYNRDINLYSYIQNKYWDVSFLSQYKLDKVDRIILSLPMNLLACMIIFNFVKSFNWKHFMKLKLDKFFVPNLGNNLIDETENPNITKRDILYSSFIISSFINLLVNLLIVIFIAHPQINNRVYSTSPILYFYCADEIFKFSLTTKLNLKGMYIIIFFAVFSILGCIMQVGSYGFA
jgi:Gpi18-like mannosyltransferase